MHYALCTYGLNLQVPQCFKTEPFYLTKTYIPLSYRTKVLLNITFPGFTFT